MFKKIKKETDVITNTDLFDEIVFDVKKTGAWPDNIDYALSNRDRIGLYNYEFDPCFILKAGGSEGYYLDLAIKGNYSLTEKYDIASLGTIKTLDTSREGVMEMAALYGECLLAYEKIMNDNLDAFTRKGFDLHFIDPSGKTMNFGFSGFKNLEKALGKLQEYKTKWPEKYAKAIIRNNLTREEKIYE